jgi:hypothetical protein
VQERDHGMRNRRPLLLDEGPDLLYHRQQTVLCIEGEGLLRLKDLCGHTNLLHYMLNAVLCKQRQDLLWQHCMPPWRNLLQRKVLRKRPILCQWAVPGFEVQRVEAAELVRLPEPPRPPARGSHQGFIELAESTPEGVRSLGETSALKTSNWCANAAPE